MIEVRHNLSELQAGLAMYARASGKTIDEVLKKKGGKDLPFEMAKEFGKLMPAKGSVRQQRLDALKAGEGVHIRKRVWNWVFQKYHVASSLSDKSLKFVRGKKRELMGSILRSGQRLNIQALAVQRELSVRESGRGFMRQGAKFPGDLQTELESTSRYGPQIGDLKFSGERHEVRLSFGDFSELSVGEVKAIYRARGQAAFAQAIKNVTEDMIPYLKKHMSDAAIAAGFKEGLKP